MIIRQYEEKDVPRLIRMRFDFTAESKEIDPALFEPFHQECSQFFQELKESGRWHIWVAEVEGEIVSHVFVQTIDTVPRPGRVKSPWAYVTNVYTVPAYRSQGIGGRIMDEVNKWAKGNGITFLLVWPSETSVAFYERHGFERAGEAMENHLRQ
jgi:GNAT superfamily N-acetyltransferase